MNVKFLCCINAIFGRNAHAPFSSLLILNVKKTYKSKNNLNVKSQRPNTRPLDVYILM